MPRTAIAVIGPGTCDPEIERAAGEVGRLLAEAGVVLVTGGRGGGMAAASRGAREAGGTVVGILPGTNPAEANAWVEIAIPTGMGELRNGLVVGSAQAVIALAGEYGTLSEIGFALKRGVPMVGWRTWELARAGVPEDGIVVARTPAHAVELALALVGR